MASMISTADNPFDPRTDYPAWYQWDVAQGYNTCAYLARVVALADEVPDVVQEFQIDSAIDEIIEMHDGEVYVKLPLPLAS